MKKHRGVVRASIPEGQVAGEALLEAVQNQIRDNRPPETSLTLARLIKMGKSKNEALRLIDNVLAVEVFEVVKDKRAFDEVKYVGHLRRLPRLPNEK